MLVQKSLQGREVVEVVLPNSRELGLEGLESLEWC